MEPASRFTATVLLYGDYPELTARVLDPLVIAPWGELRVLCNEISPRVRSLLEAYVEHGALRPECVHVSATNCRKYPMMRYAWHTLPVQTPFVMWFDDDTFTHDVQALADSAAAHLQRGAVSVGRSYTIKLRQAQRDWFAKQPWARNPQFPVELPIHPGSWWATHTGAIRLSGFPWPSLEHNGGDVAWSAWLYANGHPLAEIGANRVTINADLAGREGKSQRRGFRQHAWGLYPASDPEPVLQLPTLADLMQGQTSDE